MMKTAIGAILTLLLACGGATAAPGDYKAQRFDVVARAVDGDLDVTETITFEFQSGTFKFVFREIPASRTDGITILAASMDGAAITPSVNREDSKVRVEWRFPEVGPSVHRFELHYLARGVVYRDGLHDVVRWRALPDEHRYSIDASRIRLEPSGGDVRPPETRRVASVAVNNTSEGVTIEAANIRSNGWVIAELRFDAGQLIAAAPEWQQRAVRAWATAPKWAMGGAGVFVAGLMLVIMMRQGYSAPSGSPDDVTATEPPQPLPAALASALAAKGGRTGYQSIATILDLADRGALRVREIPGVLGIRRYELSQIPGKHDLEPHEAEALAIAFADRGDDVALPKARGRLARQARRFNAVVDAELAARGLIDPDRKAARDRVTRTGLLLVVLGAVSMGGLAALIPRYQGWPLLLSAGLVLAGIVGVIMAAAMSTLSDEGLAEAARWRGFRRYLKSIASPDHDGATTVPSRWIVYAIGLGLARSWSRHLKKHPDIAPVWFDAQGSDPGHAFAAFIGSHAASGADGGAGGAGAGGAAAGGGASGAG